MRALRGLLRRELLRLLLRHLPGKACRTPLIQYIGIERVIVRFLRREIDQIHQDYPEVMVQGFTFAFLPCTFVLPEDRILHGRVHHDLVLLRNLHRQLEKIPSR